MVSCTDKQIKIAVKTTRTNLHRHLDCPGLSAHLAVHLQGDLRGHRRHCLGLAEEKENEIKTEEKIVRSYLLEDGGGDALRGDGTLSDADLLDGGVVLALVVGNDDHHDAGLHRNNLAMLGIRKSLK